MLNDQGALANKDGKLRLQGFATEDFNIAKLIAPFYVQSAFPARHLHVYQNPSCRSSTLSGDQYRARRCCMLHCPCPLKVFSEFLEDEAMATAADYRKWAEECFEWAHAASDKAVREQYASLGRVWLEYATRAEVRSNVTTPAEPGPPQKVA